MSKHNGMLDLNDPTACPHSLAKPVAQKSLSRLVS
jgi:hypothetical protein